jgi:hypothetical protein
LFLYIISALFAVTSLSVCTARFHNSFFIHGLGLCVCTFFLSFQCLRLYILSNANVQ